MTYEEYVLAQREINLRAFRILLALLNPLRAISLSPARWVGMVASMFRALSQLRRESAELARRFYDAERERRLPGEPRHDTDLQDYWEPDWLYEALEPVRPTLEVANAKDSAVLHAVHVGIKQVEMGGRRTMLRAVDTDPKVIGWARVEGGGESCAFCLTLISRGPVYKSARTAGLQADDVSANELIQQGDESALDRLMTRWHPNCDCKVVPVFDRNNWVGRDRYLEALELWKQASRGSKNNKDAINRLRKILAARQPGDLESRPLAA